MTPLLGAALDGIEGDLFADPFVWSHGSLVLDKVSGVGNIGSGVFAHASGAAWFHQR